MDVFWGVRNTTVFHLLRATKQPEIRDACPELAIEEQLACMAKRPRDICPALRSVCKVVHVVGEESKVVLHTGGAPRTLRMLPGLSHLKTSQSWREQSRGRDAPAGENTVVMASRRSPVGPLPVPEADCLMIHCTGSSSVSRRGGGYRSWRVLSLSPLSRCLCLSSLVLFANPRPRPHM